MERFVIVKALLSGLLRRLLLQDSGIDAANAVGLFNTTYPTGVT